MLSDVILPCGRFGCFAELCGRSTKGNSFLGFSCALVDLFFVHDHLFIAGAFFFLDGVVRWCGILRYYVQPTHEIAPPALYITWAFKLEACESHWNIGVFALRVL